MKNLLNYYYHIYPDKIYLKNEIYYFYLNEQKYYLAEFYRNIEELTTLVELSNMLYEKGIKVHTFIKNINESFFVTFANTNYVLLRVNCIENESVDIYDIIKFNYLVTVDENILYKNRWEVRWSSQVDVFEQQMTEYNKEYPLIYSYFDYYIGLAENAISYVKTIKFELKEEKLYLSHKHMPYPINNGTLYNPLNFMFDNKVRDVSEYIKSKFFNSIFEFEEFAELIKMKNLTLNDIKLLYARLIYPTYYFDYFENLIENKVEENYIRKYVNLSQDYEKFLLDVFKYLKKNYNLEGIDWLVNNP